MWLDGYSTLQLYGIVVNQNFFRLKLLMKLIDCGRVSCESILSNTYRDTEYPRRLD